VNKLQTRHSAGARSLQRRSSRGRCRTIHWHTHTGHRHTVRARVDGNHRAALASSHAAFRHALLRQQISWHSGGTSFGAAARRTTTRQRPALQHLLNTSASAMAMTTASFTLRAARPAPARASAFACGAPPLAIISARRPSQPRRGAAPVTAALPSCSCAAGVVFQSAASTTAAVCATSLVTYLAWGSARAFSLAEVTDVLTLRKGAVHAAQQVRARDERRRVWPRFALRPLGSCRVPALGKCRTKCTQRTQ
jgi:hypothetical protein